LGTLKASIWVDRSGSKSAGIPHRLRAAAVNKEFCVNWRLWTNFIEMPSVLKLIVVSGLVFPGFVVGSIVSPVEVFGRDVGVGAWWASGGGPFMVVTGMLLWSASVRMLKRSAWGRHLYVGAWIVMGISGPVVVARLHITSVAIVCKRSVNHALPSCP